MIEETDEEEILDPDQSDSANDPETNRKKEFEQLKERMTHTS